VSDLFGAPEFDAQAEWVGMPEFVQKSQEPYQKLIVNFASQEDVDAFAKLVGYDLSSKSRSIWFPYRDRTNRKAWEYTDANSRTDE
jgi:hypothetical protein